ncbi:MAG: isoleucine--tRNA ligase [Myxococcales bacterium]|nr:isoleucine--tRNA ligase [Myxococcales bacterium]
MAFDKVDQAVPNFPELESRILELWKARRVFERSLEETRGKPEFVFYEGPPTANGRPHNGHVLTRVIKDLFPRYMTMRGYHVARRAGWDTHGLPVEVEVEKELRISGKEAIIEYGVDRFSKKCMESVFRYTEEWEHLTERIGFWVNLDEAYVTYHKSYVESVWWALSELFKKGLLYRGHKVVWWWAQGGTALSSGEVGNAYKTVDDPSAYVRFPLVGEDAALVVWTTTPWTLPSNMFAAVHAEFEYAYAKDQESGETLVLAKDLVPTLAQKLGRELEITKVVKGSQLIGKRYTPPFDVYAKELPETDDRYWRVVPGNKAPTGTPQWFVTLEAGTGVVHLAPAFGEDDWKVWRNEKMTRDDVEMLCSVRVDGKLDHRLASLGLEGVWVKDADKTLIKDLDARGVLLFHETYRHEYPFCWRADDDPLIQYARDAWFIRTTAKIDQVIENNQQTTWFPEHIRDGRFGDFLGSNVDWALSRERFWGTPLNIWICDGCGHMEAPDSCAAIEAKNPEAFAHFRAAQAEDPTLSEHLMVHKPWIDQVTFGCAKCSSGTMRRVPEVIDCWFDSGCMPFAQLGYPHKPGSQEAFKRAFPADFISEAVDQTRGWFYSLMTISNLIFEKAPAPHPYKRCIVLGLVLDRDGKKESKSKGNYTPPEVILDGVRMEFAPVTLDAPYAKAVKAVKPGSVYIAREDLEGLDLKEGAHVHLYRKAAPETRSALTIHVGKGLPRRVVLMADEDRAALGLALAKTDVMPSEVPSQPADQRVVVEFDEVPAPGADAFRWFFYASNPPWNNTRHSLSNVRVLQKELPIKLRNVYSFFVTYANIDSFDPMKDEPSKRPTRERPLLDRWILSELEKTKMKVVTFMDEYRSYEATQVLSEFVDGLSNWYVRRSRERFWAEGRGQDKLDAYWTLYQCLRDFSVMIAPFLPFAAEDMYQNLVVKVCGEGYPDSVHLRLYPSGDDARIDEGLSRDMAEVRALVSLGLQVRAKSKIKTRQPLKEAEIVLADVSREPALAPYVDIMKEELNVQGVKFVGRAEDYVTYLVKPNFQSLGKRLGKKMKATQVALARTSADQLKRALDKDGRVTLPVDGDTVDLGADDLLVQVEAKEGFAAATGPEGVVVLDCTLDEALVKDGLFREVLSRIQAARKEMQLDFAARIKLALNGDPAVMAVCAERAEAIKKETLAVHIELGGSLGGRVFEVKVEGEPLTVEILPAPPPRGASQAG